MNAAEVGWAMSMALVLGAGVVLGFVRAWWFALLGVVVPGIMLLASRLVSNNPLPGSEDMSWRIVVVSVAAEGAILFFASFAVGALLHVAADRIRRRSPRAPTTLDGRSG